MRSILVCLVIAAAVCSGAADDATAAPFELEAYQLPAETRLISAVDSDRAGTFGGLCVPADVYQPLGLADERDYLGRFEVVAGEVVLDSVVPRSEFGAGDPKLILNENSILIKQGNLSSGWESRQENRDSVRFSIYTPATRTSIDVTPGNLQDAPRWDNEAGPPAMYSEEHGLALFIYDRDSRCTALWQGHATLAEAGRTPPLLAQGEGFASFRYTRAMLTDDGRLFVYDWDSGALVEPAAHAALAKQLAAQIGAERDTPARFAFADGLAIFKCEADGAPVYRVVDASGRYQDLRRKDLSVSLEDAAAGNVGDGLTDEEARELWNSASEEEKQRFALAMLEGMAPDPASVPLDVCDLSSFILPIDNEHVGVFDTLLQRLVVIGPGS